jgi:2-iminobutanoate/2-iminopropanoate deaminase
VDVTEDIREIILAGSVDPAPAGIRVGDLIYCGRIAGTDPSGELADELQAQIRNIFSSMRLAVERAGASIDNIARVSLFMRSLGDLQEVNKVWVEHFPNAEDRPTYKFLQVNLAPGRQLEADFIAIAGARRRTLAIGGVAHTNPIPLAVKIGSMLFSSRVLPSDVEKGAYGETPERQAELSFQHAARLCELAGGSPANICQIRAFVKEPGFKNFIDAQVRKMFSGAKQQPYVDVLHYPTSGPLQAMIEIMADGLPPD